MLIGGRELLKVALSRSVCTPGGGAVCVCVCVCVYVCVYVCVCVRERVRGLTHRYSLPNGYLYPNVYILLK